MAVRVDCDRKSYRAAGKDADQRRKTAKRTSRLRRWNGDPMSFSRCGEDALCDQTFHPTKHEL